MSEFSLINKYFKNATARHNSTIIGIGDDGAVSRLSPKHELVSCTDMLIAGRHFPQHTPAYAIGYKSVAVNLSDLASMGAMPFAILLAIGLPKHLANDAFLGELTQGISDICTQFKTQLIGGDTTQTDSLTLCITALGSVPCNMAIKRDGAKVGDLICVSGEIGSASLALTQILSTDNSLNNAPPTNTHLDNTLSHLDSTLYHALVLPSPQVALGQKLIGVANSMIDVSDGLGQDLGHILTQSGVGARLFLEKIPTNAHLKKLPTHQQWQHIINGGDDYQLCFTLPSDKFCAFNDANPNSIFVIGEIIDGAGVELYHHNQKIQLPIKGWQHF